VVLMSKGRLEAFSDGVIAIIITIMVLEMRAPHEATFSALGALVPVFLSYVLSFVIVGIYWNNHHHLCQAATGVSGGILWANLHLLFWLSLLPFATSWMGENHAAPLPVAVYGGVLLAAGTAYYILVRALLRHHDKDSPLARAIGSDFKGRISLVFYAAGMALAFWNVWVALALYVAVAVIWLVPDRRIERALASEHTS
jgi:TMEM175 potassium channel family protein